MSAPACPLWSRLEYQVSKWPEGDVLQSHLSPTTERRLAACPRRHSHVVSVENGPLKIAPPSFFVGAPPRWFMWCVQNTRNGCPLSVDLSSIPRTTRSTAGEPEKHGRQYKFSWHSSTLSCFTTSSAICRWDASNLQKRWWTISETWR